MVVTVVTAAEETAAVRALQQVSQRQRTRVVAVAAAWFRMAALVLADLAS
jgi:hypothetical protein